jgi:hypothetical protein
MVEANLHFLDEFNAQSGTSLDMGLRCQCFLRLPRYDVIDLVT